mmetsp:Transcript_10242/g.34800  ORF Transcript_10242/g.34800 Transcript_10242/m.34800 type:complete len:910 (+) Transcript_10242:99-2828(+)
MCIGWPWAWRPRARAPLCDSSYPPLRGVAPLPGCTGRKKGRGRELSMPARPFPKAASLGGRVHSAPAGEGWDVCPASCRARRARTQWAGGTPPIPRAREAGGESRRCGSLGDRHLLVHPGAAARAEVLRGVAVLGRGPQLPAGGEETLKAHGPARVYPARADPNLAPEAEAEAVGEAGARVVEDARRVHRREELARRLLVLGDDELRVGGAVLGDVLHGRVHVRDNLHAQRRVAILHVHALRGGEAEELLRVRTGEHRDARALEALDHRLGAAVLGALLVEEHGLHGIARGRVVRLCVRDEPYRLGHVRRLVHKGMTDAVGVAEHRDGRVLHHVLHEGRAAARDDEVDVLVHGEETGHLRARLEEADHVLGHAPLGGVGHRAGDDGVQGAVGVQRLAAALHQDAVARDECERRHLREHVGAGLEDDEEHADGHGLLHEVEAVGDLGLAQDAAQGVVLLGERTHAVHHGLKLLWREAEAAEDGCVHVGLLGGLHVHLVGLVDGVGVLQEGVGHALEHRGALRAGQLLQLAAGGAHGGRARLGAWAVRLGGAVGLGLGAAVGLRGLGLAVGVGRVNGQRRGRLALRRRGAVGGGLRGRDAALGRLADEECADLLARKERVERVRAVARGDDDGAHAALQGAESRLDLGRHAAAPRGGLVADGHAGVPRQHIDHVRLLARRGHAPVDALDVGEEHDEVGVEEGAQERREAVVVLEPRLGEHLGAPRARHVGPRGGDGVILVEHRDGVVLEEPVDGALQLTLHALLAKVVGRDEHLGALHAVLAEELLVEAHEARLARGCTGLGARRTGLLGDKLHVGGHAAGEELLAEELGSADAHGAAGHEDDLLALAIELAELLDEVADAAERDGAVLAADGARAHLDDDALGRRDVRAGPHLDAVHAAGARRGRDVLRI